MRLEEILNIRKEYIDREHNLLVFPLGQTKTKRRGTPYTQHAKLVYLNNLAMAALSNVTECHRKIPMSQVSQNVTECHRNVTRDMAPKSVTSCDIGYVFRLRVRNSKKNMTA